MWCITKFLTPIFVEYFSMAASTSKTSILIRTRSLQNRKKCLINNKNAKLVKLFLLSNYLFFFFTSSKCCCNHSHKKRKDIFPFLVTILWLTKQTIFRETFYFVFVTLSSNSFWSYSKVADSDLTQGRFLKMIVVELFLQRFSLRGLTSSKNAFCKKYTPSYSFDFDILLAFWEQKYWNTAPAFG